VIRSNQILSTAMIEIFSLRPREYTNNAPGANGMLSFLNETVLTSTCLLAGVSDLAHRDGHAA